jgi:hypothetical protein
MRADVADAAARSVQRRVGAPCRLLLARLLERPAQPSLQVLDGNFANRSQLAPAAQAPALRAPASNPRKCASVHTARPAFLTADSSFQYLAHKSLSPACRSSPESPQPAPPAPPASADDSASQSPQSRFRLRAPAFSASIICCSPHRPAPDRSQNCTPASRDRSADCENAPATSSILPVQFGRHAMHRTDERSGPAAHHSHPQLPAHRLHLHGTSAETTCLPIRKSSI